MLAVTLIATVASLARASSDAIFPTDGQSFAFFGRIVSADPTSRALVISAPGDGYNAKVYLYEDLIGYKATETILNPELKLPIPYPNYFGSAVSVNERSIFVGASRNRAPGNPDAGSVYVYKRRAHGPPKPPPPPSQQTLATPTTLGSLAAIPSLPVTQKLALPDVSQGENFGKALKSSENLLIVGSDGLFGDGLAFIYKFNAELFR